MASGVAGSACDFGGDAERSAKTNPSGSISATPEVVEIESSLEGFDILPRRIRWTVETSLPPEQVKEVRFGIDANRKLWRDSSPPYSFGEEGTQLGTWPGPGRHRFTVRVIATDGSRTVATVTARVQKTKTDQRAIEQGLWGAWG